MPEHDAYQLRPRATRRREPRERRPPQPLSKYRRKTANARERSRMREINRAFETLRRAVPAAAVTGAPVPCETLRRAVPAAAVTGAPVPCETLRRAVPAAAVTGAPVPCETLRRAVPAAAVTGAPVPCETLRRAVPAAAVTGAPVPCEKLTKITTLRLAMRYITALATALREADGGAGAGSGSECAPERWPSPPSSELSDLSAEPGSSLGELAEDSLSPFDSFFAEFECDYIDRTFA